MLSLRRCPHCHAALHALALQHLGEGEAHCAACGGLVDNPAPPSVAPAAPPPGTRILCIDDDLLLQHLMGVTLQHAGFVPLTAHDGSTGLALARAERPAAVLVDLMMPGMDGFEVCRRLKADRRTQDLPVIILTARTHPQLVLEAARAGADLALTKPCPPDKLLAALRATLGLAAPRPTSE